MQLFYFSYTNFTKKVVNDLEKEFSFLKIEELKPKDYKQKTGFMKFFWGGKQVIFKEEPQLENTINISDDIIILAFPIWAGNITPPIRTFLKSCDLTNKKVILIATSEGGSLEKVSKTFSELQPNANLITTLHVLNKKSYQIDEVINFIKEI